MALSERDGEGAAPIDRGAASKETRQVAATRMEVKMIINGLSAGYYDT